MLHEGSMMIKGLNERPSFLYICLLLLMVKTWPLVFGWSSMTQCELGSKLGDWFALFKQTISIHMRIIVDG